MNNLHRELAPISDAAWAQIEEEAARTLKRYLAGRRLVDDVIEPSQTRRCLAQALEALHTKREFRPPKKHGLIPL